MAAENAIQNPLLDEVTLKGAKAVLVNITGGLDMTLLEVDEAANAISGQVDPEANIIFGAAFDPSLEGVVRVSVVATGMDGASIAAIESYQQRRRESAAGRMPEPAVEAIDAVAEPVAAEAEPALAAADILEPALAAAEAARPAAQQPGFTFDEPALAAAPAAVVPLQPVARIVDPAANEEEPLFAPMPYADERKQKGGWLSLFGGRRQENGAPAPAPARSSGGAQPAMDVMEDEDDQERDDLEIPSFLRRLAN
jgi:cell division protein FtsZ